MIKRTAKTVFSTKKYKKREKTSFKSVERLITKKVIALAQRNGVLSQSQKF